MDLAQSLTQTVASTLVRGGFARLYERERGLLLNVIAVNQKTFINRSNNPVQSSMLIADQIRV